MERLDVINIPRIYNLYRCFAGQTNENNQGIGATNKEVMPEWYYCAHCGTTFMVKHRRRQVSMFYYGYGDDSVSCPNCSETSVTYNRNFKQIAFCLNKRDCPEAWSRWNDKPLAPFNVKLELFMLKNGVRIKASFRTIEMFLTDGRSDVTTKFDKRIEVFDFDIKNRKATFKLDKEEPIEIGRPHDWEKLKDWSMLSSLAADVFASDNAMQEDSRIYKVVAFIKNMRKAVQTKWQEIHGFSLKRIDTKASRFEAGGLALRQIHNIAFRMVYPDLCNIKLGQDTATTPFGSIVDIINDFEAARKSRNSVQYVIKALELPNNPSVRRMVAKDTLSALELKAALSTTDNFDCDMAIYNKLNSKDISGASMPANIRCKMYSFFKRLTDKYRPSVVSKFVVNTKNFSDLEDLEGLASDLGIESFTKPLGKMHDYLLEHKEILREQRIYNEMMLKSCDVTELNVPEHVKKKLMMQLNSGRGKFFLPETNIDLQLTSDLMSNCVRTYEDRIKSQRCNIVYYTDDMGKLLACIEVRGKEVVQAKLSHNRPVEEDSAVNKAIVEWCQAKGLEINTYDIYTGEEEAVADGSIHAA